MTDTKKVAEIAEGELTHFISKPARGGGNVTACGKTFAWPMRGNGWRVRDISCPDCDRALCDIAHDHITGE